jgi:hypothetical protein
MAETKKCAHDGCDCQTTEKYCSEVCKDSKSVTALVCHCGHPGCRAHGMSA